MGTRKNLGTAWSEPGHVKKSLQMLHAIAGNEVAGRAGATSPAALAGALVQQVAKLLAALVWVNLMVPGHPAIFGTWPFVSELRTGTMSGGSGEQAVLSAACTETRRTPYCSVARYTHTFHDGAGHDGAGISVMV